MLAAGMVLSMTACGGKTTSKAEPGVANTDTSQTEFDIMGGISALSKGYDKNEVLNSRIVRIAGEDITLYGDGNFSPEYIKRSDVIAIAAGFYRKNSEKLSKCDAPLYQLYWRVWVRLRPVRRYLLLIWKFWHYPGLTIKEIKSKLHK